MKNGGKRPGAGRKKGIKDNPAIAAKNKAFRDFTTPALARKFVDRAMKLAMKDNKMLMFVIDQIFGKAISPITTPDEQPIMIKLDI